MFKKYEGFEHVNGVCDFVKLNNLSRINNRGSICNQNFKTSFILLLGYLKNNPLFSPSPQISVSRILQNSKVDSTSFLPFPFFAKILQIFVRNLDKIFRSIEYIQNKHKIHSPLPSYKLQFTNSLKFSSPNIYKTNPSKNSQTSSKIPKTRNHQTKFLHSIIIISLRRTEY